MGCKLSSQLMRGINFLRKQAVRISQVAHASINAGM